MHSVLVIIPTYNEKENINDIIHAVLTQSEDIHILVVDDNSPDGTGQIVKDLQAKQKERLFLLERQGKLGLGTAYIAGFKYGIEHNYKYIMEMDADFSHNPSDVNRLIAACKADADIAVGSRYVSEGGVKDWDWFRHLLSKGASYYVKILTGMSVDDPTAGFVCYRTSVLSAIKS